MAARRPFTVLRLRRALVGAVVLTLLGATGASPVDAAAPATAAPSVTLTATSEDVHGLFVSLSGTGFAPGEVQMAYLCKVDPHPCPSENLTRAVALLTAAADGTVSDDVFLPRLLPNGDGTFDCGVSPGCYVVVINRAGAFASSTPVPFTPVLLTTAIEPYGTYGPEPRDAVVRATISCNRPTPIVVLGEISQGGASGHHVFSTPPVLRELVTYRWCRPTAPVRAYIPARNPFGTAQPGSFGPGPASVSVSGSAGSTLDDHFTTTATVTLIDQVALGTFIAGQIRSGDRALEAAMTDAINARAWQDPEFDAELPPLIRPDTVFVTGDGEELYDQIYIDARSGPTGNDPVGVASFEVYGVHVTGPVTCLSVTGGGTGAGRPDAPTTATLVLEDQIFGTVVVTVVDNGGNGNDRISTLPEARATTDCTPLAPGVGVEDRLWREGRAVVVGASPVPSPSAG